ncbi:MAG TPA: DUF418 domain-containing protein, partial [Gemmatimonadales bacterium]|nr:DUF418 domain-containing protein [Gemmatimonadales bacterium]
MPQARPATQRIAALDILRGLALLGMILVHFHQLLERAPAAPTWLDEAEGWFVWLFVEGKSWGVFAMLFGAGFALMARGLAARGEPVGRIMARRFLSLAVIGAALQVGTGFHVLMDYAVSGFWLLLLHRRSTRTLLIAAAIAASLTVLYALAQGAHVRRLDEDARAVHVARREADRQAARARQERLATAEQGPSYAALVAARWEGFVAAKRQWRAYAPGIDLALLIVGLLAVRHGVVEDPLGRRRLLLRAMGLGFASWVVGRALMHGVPDTFSVGPLQAWMIQGGLGLVRDQWLCLTYAGAVLLLLASRPAWHRRLASFGVVGRMAFTAYVLQVVALDAMRAGYGLSLRIRPAATPLATALLFG